MKPGVGRGCRTPYEFLGGIGTWKPGWSKTNLDIPVPVCAKSYLLFAHELIICLGKGKKNNLVTFGVMEVLAEISYAIFFSLSNGPVLHS